MKIKVYLMVFILFAIAGGIFYTKVYKYGIPLIPDHEIATWHVEARVHIVGENKTARINLELPTQSNRFEIVSENYVSNGFGIEMLKEDGSRKAVWTGLARKQQEYDFFYRAVIQRRKTELAPMTLKGEFPPQLSEEQLELVRTLGRRLRHENLKGVDFIEGLLKEVVKGDSETARRLRSEYSGTTSKMANLLVQVFRSEGIPARPVQGIKLNHPQRASSFVHWIEVFNEGRWLPLNVHQADMSIPDYYFGWRRTEAPMLEAKRVESSSVQISVTPQDTQRFRFQVPEELRGSFPWLQNLPVEAQAVYRLIIVIPIGALVVAFLRCIIGFRTMGTFMPVLVALSFREMDLFWGVALYAGIVALSLCARYIFENLQLLVVPRLTATLTLVVIIIIIFSYFTETHGVHNGLSVALFPIVILTMTIERMSIMWEEIGPLKAIWQGIFSLAVAALVYLVIANKYVEFYFFMFPELLLVVLAISIMLGRFTGYRISELYRFRSLVKEEG